MTAADPIIAPFHSDGWITCEINSVPALGFKTERLTVHITNLAGTDLPTSDTDWRITYFDTEDGQSHTRAAPTDEPWTRITDAVTYLPAYQLICASCGSDDVVADAVARWDGDNACWDLSSTFDDRVCCSCNAEGASILRAILPLPNHLAQNAAQ